jgi:hypothetical protein
MSDAHQNLRSSLTALRDQLQSTSLPDAEVSPEMRSLLEGVMTDIDQVLRSKPSGMTATSATGTQDQKSLVHRLTSAEKQFEETHPTLAGIVGSLIDALSRMGI